jgi:hypothetical protein
MILNVLEIYKKNVLSVKGPSHELEIFSFFVCDTGFSDLFVMLNFIIRIGYELSTQAMITVGAKTTQR